MPIIRLSILGVGLLGGSIGLAVRQRLNQCHVVGYGHRASTLDAALKLGAIHQALSDPGQAVKGADFVILATPVGQFDRLLEAIKPHLSPSALVTDVGSTKRSIVGLASSILDHHERFVGSHPIAGGEQRGIAFARADLFHGATCITTPIDTTEPAALEAVESFWRTLGMRVTRLTPSTHDQLLADISHLPHALAAALVAIQNPAGLSLAGKGLADTTRIAAGDGGLWRDIFIDNADNLRASLDKLRRELDRFEALLDPARHEQLKAYLDAVAERRRTLPGLTESNH